MNSSDDHLKHELTSQTYAVTQENNTEPAFSGKYDNFDEPGIYVDVITGEPLFSSTDKYDAGLGWPTFTKSLVTLVEVPVEGKIELRSPKGDNHLGHLFLKCDVSDSGKRYSINSAALNFISADKLIENNLEAYVNLFK